MKIVIKRGGNQKTEHGYVLNGKPEFINASYEGGVTVVTNDCAADECRPHPKKKVAVIKLNRHIHPSLKGKIECYDGEYFELEKGDEYYGSWGEGCDKC